MQNNIDSLHKEIANSNTSNTESDNLNNSTNSAGKSNSNSVEKDNSNNTKTNDEISFQDEQVKEAFENYLDLMSYASCDGLLEELTEKGKLNYNSDEDNILDDSTVITKVKFNDYKNAMLNYVSENEFENNWSSTLLGIKENDDGYLTKYQGGG